MHPRSLLPLLLLAGCTSNPPTTGRLAQGDADGVQLDGDSGLRVALRAWGSGETRVAAPPVGPELDSCIDHLAPQSDCEQQLTYRRPGLVEAWTPQTDGLEQSFTLERAPAGNGPISLEIALEGGLGLEVAGQVAQVVDPRGHRWTISDLSAWDADGKSLHAWMEAGGDALVLRVDAATARYPILIDPVYTTAEATLSELASDDHFGQSVSAAGDVNGDGYDDVIVGAPFEDASTGAAYVFFGGASGVDATAATLNGPSEGSLFGSSVSAAGDVNGDGYDDVIVGASSAESGAGAAYLYLGGPSGPADAPDTTLVGPEADSRFGDSVRSAGDVNGDGYDDLIVGADGVSRSTGAASLYLGGASGLETTAAATLTGPGTFSYFGQSVSGAGDVNGDGYDDVIVGCPYLGLKVGTVYLYLGNASGVDTTAARAIDGFVDDSAFGTTISGVGDVDGDGYDDILIGAPGESGGAGAVYLFDGTSLGLTPTPAARMGSITVEAEFGASVSGAGDVNGDGYADVIIGAYGVSDGAGEATVYEGSAAGLDTTPVATLSGAEAAGSFGSSVSGAGDVNGDGYDDVIIGAPDVDAEAGTASVYDGYAQDDDGDGWKADLDCDDSNPSIYPGAVEICDGADSDCDGVVPDDESDADGDGHHPCDGDCDDANPDAYAGAVEHAGDGVDEDCDGLEACYVDADGDGTRTTSVVFSADIACDAAGEALATAVLDCDDTDAARAPDLPEVCDGQDNDCDGVVPDDEVDDDADGWLLCQGDCADDNPTIFPGADDAPGDGIDQDCDGSDAVVDTGDSGGDSATDTAPLKDTGTPKGVTCGCASDASGPALGWAGMLLAVGLLRRRLQG